jgi:hypothetical protein
MYNTYSYFLSELEDRDIAGRLSGSCKTFLFCYPNRADWTELNWTELNWNELNWTELNWNELNWTEMNWTELNWNELNWTELNWNEMNWTELNWTEMNWTELNLMFRQLAIKWIQSAKLSGSDSDHTCPIPRLSMSGAIPPLHLRLSLAERNNFTFRTIFKLLVFITRKWQACYIIIIRQALGVRRPFK